MESNIGRRVFTEINRADASLVRCFKNIPSSNIGDVLNRLSCMISGIKPYSCVKSLAGTALTVKAPEGDNLLFHYAIKMAKPGDVIVVNGWGSKSRSLCGEMMFNEAKAKGIEGFVIDGCIRDVDSLETLKFPVYASGVTPQGPWKFGPGEINVPIACGGQVVFPGDIIIGDSDGVVVIHKSEASAILEDVRKKYDYEQELLNEFHHEDFSGLKDLDSYTDPIAKAKIEIIDTICGNY